jgi:hypothetical protein
MSFATLEVFPERFGEPLLARLVLLCHRLTLVGERRGGKGGLTALSRLAIAAPLSGTVLP